VDIKTALAKDAKAVLAEDTGGSDEP